MLFKQSGRLKGRNIKLPAQMLRVMKLTAILLTVAALQVSAGGFSQKLTLNLYKAPMEKVFKEIRRQTGYAFFYEKGIVQNADKVSIQVKEAGIEHVLDKCFSGQQLDYSIVDKTIVVKEKPIIEKPAMITAEKEEAIPPPPVPIRGVVKDDNGTPLTGVSVVVRGTQKGTTTNSSGAFSIDAQTGDVLEFSMVGYKKVSVTVGNNPNISVTMEMEAAMGNDVVVVGYGTQKKATLTGAVSSVSMQSLKEAPVTNFSNTLAGKLPGVITINNSGEPGGDGSTILVRGNHSINNNAPLVVIDGVPNRGGGLERLDPNDIESISVLKDATASIYGSEAANGVILITTRRGIKNKPPELTLNLNQGYNQPTRVPEVADAPTYMTMINESELYHGLPPAFPQADIDAYKDPNRNPWLYPNTDWFEEGLKKFSPQTKADISVQGGSSNIAYFISVGAQTQEGYYKNSATKYNQYNFRSNLDGQITKNLKLTFDLSGRKEDRNYPTVSAAQTFRMLIRGRPTDPAYYPNGLPGPDQEGGVQPVVTGTTLTGYDHNQRYFLSGDVSLDLTIPAIKGFDIKGTFSYNKEFREIKNWQVPWMLYTFDKQAYINNGMKDPEQFLEGTLRGVTDPQLRQTYYTEQNIQGNLVANYKHSFDNHNISIMAGAEQRQFEDATFNAFRRHFISTSIPQLFAGGQQDWSNNGSAAHGSRMSYFSRVNYNYQSKYLFEFVGRYDGSYLFPKNSRFGFFPAFSAGWRISEEDFFQNNRLFNDLKIRASWGRTGNDIVSPNSLVERQQFLSGYVFGSGYVLGIDQVVPSIYQSLEANPEVTWETSNQGDIGVDAVMFDNRLSFTIDYWNQMRSGILITRNASIPQSTGLTLPRENLGKVKSWGYDGTIAWNQQIKKDLSFQVRLNAGYANNKIIFWDEAPNVPEYQVSTGKKVSTDLYYDVIGVFQNLEQLDKYPHWTGARPGDLIFRDVNSDGKIDANDRIRVNKGRTPDWTGGVHLAGSWKNFSVSIFFQGAAGAVQYLSTESGDIGNYLQQFAEQRWIPDPNDATGKTPLASGVPYPGPRTYNRTDAYWSPQGSNDNTFFLRSTNYIRLKTLEIGYSLPKALLSKLLGIQYLRVYANGYNLITWDKFKVMDPEASNAAGDYYPQSRVFNMGVSITF